VGTADRFFSGLSFASPFSVSKALKLNPTSLQRRHTKMSAGPSSHRLVDTDVYPTSSINRDPKNTLSLKEWCPHTADLIYRQFSRETASFLFSLPRKPAALRNHSGCTETRCIANDTTLMEGGRYNSAHWKGCLRCEFLGPDSQKIRDIIGSGGIPLISLRSGDDGRPVVDVVKATARSKFVAVSHVWSGGLGNPHDNALPICQMKRLLDMWPKLIHEMRSSQVSRKGFWTLARLRKCIRKERAHSTFRALKWLFILYIMLIVLPYYYCVFTMYRAAWALKSMRPAKILYWFDTLCIPLGQEHLDLKMRAINSMAKIYANAQAIVILDHELQQTKYRDMSVSQLTGLLACSAWMSRCWTFQEGAMAQY